MDVKIVNGVGVQAYSHVQDVLEARCSVDYGSIITRHES